MANFRVKCEGVPAKPIADLPPTYILSYKGRKIGFMGLCDQTWETLFNSAKDDEDGDYIPFLDKAQELSKELRNAGCDYIIALTHMKSSNDRILASKTKGQIDLILGGHDHE